MDHQKIEKKWQKKWLDAGINKATQKNGKKFFMIFAYPGISGFLHVGHMRGYSYVDIITRYKRMLGYDVLFPVGTHASGNQAIAFANKIKKGDKDWIDYLKSNGATEADIKKLAEVDNVLSYFNNVYIEDYWKRFGFLADWDTFTCTTYPDYNRFIQWQFKKLHDANLLVQKPYFATFCPEHGPVAVDPSETDISKGGTAEKMEYTLLKFKLGNDFLVAATLRPETIYGQTNLWINPDIDYVKTPVGKEAWIVSKEAAAKLAHQMDGVKPGSKIDAKELIGKTVKAPGIEREIPILETSFCKADVGTGIVTSVPSDAPYDYIALLESKQKIRPIPIIRSKDCGDFPAEEICKKMGIKSLDDPKLEEATKEIYMKGFHTGVMNQNCGRYSGMKVAEAKDAVKKDLISSGKAAVMHDLSEEVICRCGQRIFIKRIDDQWFIRYSDKKLTEDSKKHASNMEIFPEDYKKNLPGILDWFDDRACARLGNWLGTKLPFDEKWTVEPISDSTLYPAYYIISKHVNTKKISAKDLTEDFFDYVFLGRGAGKKEWKQIREDFDYWYPLDINLGGKEHQTVHFPVFIMNHVGVLDKKFWPRGIFVNYWITGEGGKISKSKGGAQPIPGAIEKFSVDALRLYYANIGSPHSDIVWKEDDVFRYKSQIDKIWKIASEAEVSSKNEDLDKWLESALNESLLEIEDALDYFDLRTYSEVAFFVVYNKYRWYQRRGGRKNDSFLKIWAKVMCPIAPHTAEEIWEHLGGKGLVSSEAWPKADENKVVKILHDKERSLEKIIDDVNHIKKIANIEKPSVVRLLIIPKDTYIKDAQKFLENELGCKVEITEVNKTDEPKAKKAKPGRPAIIVE